MNRDEIKTERHIDRLQQKRQKYVKTVKWTKKACWRIPMNKDELLNISQDRKTKRKKDRKTKRQNDEPRWTGLRRHQDDHRSTTTIKKGGMAVSARSFDLLNSMIYWSRWSVDSKWMIKHRWSEMILFIWQCDNYVDFQQFVEFPSLEVLESCCVSILCSFCRISRGFSQKAPPQLKAHQVKTRADPLSKAALLTNYNFDEDLAVISLLY